MIGRQEMAELEQQIRPSVPLLVQTGEIASDFPDTVPLESSISAASTPIVSTESPSSHSSCANITEANLKEIVKCLETAQKLVVKVRQPEPNDGVE